MLSVPMRLALAAALGLDAFETIFTIPNLPIGGSRFVQTAVFVIGAIVFDEVRDCIRRKDESNKS